MILQVISTTEITVEFRILPHQRDVNPRDFTDDADGFLVSSYSRGSRVNFEDSPDTSV